VLATSADTVRQEVAMARRVVITALMCAVLAFPVFAQAPKLKDVKIRGYVTEFRSPTSFDIEDYRITRDEAFTLDFDNASPEIAFGLDDIRVGVELEIRGQLNEATGDLKAKSIRVDSSNSNPSNRPRLSRRRRRAFSCSTAHGLANCTPTGRRSS
jgi:hypothetical protein